jgi:hypothetical protein
MAEESEMTEFRIFLKQALYHWPLLALLIVLQLVLGQISSFALSETPPELSVALINESDEPLASRFESSLNGISGLNVVKLPADANRENVFLQNDVQGLAVIPARFDEYVMEGHDNAILFYPAPGVTDPSVTVEFLSTTALLLRADIITEEAIAGLGARSNGAGSGNLEDMPILVLEYNGPPINEALYLAPPAFGVPAVFLLLAFLHAVFVIPGKDNRRLLQRGMQKAARLCILSLASLLAVWVALVLIYGLWMLLFNNISISAPTVAALIGIAAYACTLGGIMSIAGKRTWAVWVFVFWILFNMTIGGGLWGSSVTNPAMIPLLPVSSVSFAGGNAVIGTVMIIVSFVVGFAVYCGAVVKVFSHKGLPDCR